MEASDIMQLISYQLPVLSALLCIPLSISYLMLKKESKTSSKLVQILIAFYITSICRWFTISSPEIFARIYPFFYISLMMSRVTCYHLVFLLTGTGAKERFCLFHYIFPILIILTLAVSSIFTGDNIWVGRLKSEYSGYFYSSPSSTIPVVFNIVFTSCYLWLGIRRLNRFRKAIDKYSANYERSSMVRVYLFFHLFYILLSLIQVLFTARFLFGNTWIANIIPPVWRFLPVGLYPVLCYDLLSGNFEIITPPFVEENSRKGELKLNRIAFEIYMRKHKPYLNPDLRITDLLLPFRTNRHYMSEFINREYQMNFSRCINTFRMQEAEQMLKNPKYNGLSEVELALTAGFSSYRSYRYFKKKSEKGIK
jgi:AraC-like DNA-binding protein